MITVMNKLRQPQVINIAGGESIHFLAKESKEISTEAFNSLELKNAINKGDILVTKMD